MSKTLKISIGDISPPLSRHTDVFDILSKWHPFNISISGNHQPCLTEFLNMMQCFENKNDTEKNCPKYVKAFILCLEKNGIKYDV